RHSMQNAITLQKSQRAEQSHRPYGVGRIRQDCNIPRRLQNAVKLQKTSGRSKAASAIITL
ncbi:MAG: hypothetical protein RSD78_09360, partial [Oscillospiraceae bacterium]